LVRGVWSGFTWLGIGTVGGLLWMRWWIFGFWHHGVSQLVILRVSSYVTQQSAFRIRF
jgi:hypothetical protein